MEVGELRYFQRLTWLKVHLRGLNFSTRIAIDYLVINCALHDLTKLYMNAVQFAF